MKLTDVLGKTIKRTVAVGIADDAEAKAAGEGQSGTLTLIFPASLTVADLVDNLCGASSPRVKWQNNNRSKQADKRDWTYTIKPVGRAAVMDPKTAIEVALASMSAEEKAAFIKEMLEKVAE